VSEVDRGCVPKAEDRKLDGYLTYGSIGDLTRRSTQGTGIWSNTPWARWTAATLGEDEDAVSTVFPPSAARYGGSMAVSTSWAQHGATTGRNAGDVGAVASPARRRRRGVQPQPLGRDAGSRGPRASSLPPALPLPSPTSSLPRFLVEAMDLDRGAVPQGGGGGTGRAGGLEGIKEWRG
jgi:hypothetical protein